MLLDIQSAPSGALKKIVIDDIELNGCPLPRYPGIYQQCASSLNLVLCTTACSIDIRLALYAHRTSLVNCALSLPF